MAALSVRLPTAVRGPRAGVVATAVAAPLILLLARLLPADGIVLGARLAAAAVCVLVIPGWLIVRALDTRADAAVVACAALSVSLGIAFVAFTATFAVGGSLWLVVGLIAAAAAAALVPALLVRSAGPDRAEWRVLTGVVAAALVFAALVWWATQTVGTGDALMHIARSRKLAEADVLSSVDVANEYRDGGLHPGYAFPLWHGMVALVARLAGVDVATATLHLSAILVPVAFVVAYAAGRALFGSWAGGVATLAAQVAQLGFSRGGVGSFDSLALPASATRILLVPALLALAFACLRLRSRRLLLPLAAASLAVAVVHPTYLIFVAIPLTVLVVGWLFLSSARRRAAPTAALILAAVVLPAVGFFLWLLPVVTSTASHAPAASEESRAIVHYGAQLQVVGNGYRAAPETITRAGPVVIAGLAAIPLVALFGRRAWRLFIVLGSLAILALLLVPELFTRFSDLVSISQSRRLAQFLPIPFAVAAAAAILARARHVGVALALAAGLVLELLYAAELTHIVERGGPTWPLWVALIGGPAGLLAAFLLRGRVPAVAGGRGSTIATGASWPALAGVAFAIPLAVGGLADVERAEAADPHALSRGVIAAIDRLPDDDVVLAPVETSYRIPAFANVYVVATPPPHAADTEQNRPYARQRTVIRFFAPQSGLSPSERRDVLTEFGAEWVLVDKTKSFPREFLAPFERTYEDRRYLLLHTPAT